ncbi:DUF4350 domain-containing protein [Solitalea lacus]|uniref:DUF4350 domain-containing protein n=1 Tax=Solitalea lacus TaxID=2911172 RepID=UPI001EDADB0F|nr:DUF4350 domain-containing protein [Solitalea lacus]UKJ08170.1 hypothetical protein L2B55_03130 [Solitalea lacus]
MKGNRKYIAILTIIFLGFGLFEYYRPKPINWSITLSNKDKIPFGTYATFELMKDIFPGKKIISSRLPIYNQLTETNDTSGNYILITPQFNVDTNDVHQLLRFANLGNNVFIGSSAFHGYLADTLKFNIVNPVEEKQYKTRLLWNKREPVYTFIAPRENAYFDSINCATTVVLGKKENQKPDFIKIKQGKGAIYINLNSTAFSNYFVLDKETGEYAFKCLSYLPNQTTIWDEYLKQGRVGEDDIFRVIMEHASLKWAYYLLIFGMAVFIIFEGKRRQRIIPVIKPLENNTLEFTKVVGALYFNNGNHTDVAQKKVNYFLEYLRSHFFERTNELNDEFIHHFTIKTGYDAEKMQKLIEAVRWIKVLPANYELSEGDLISLNNQIEEFYQFVKK